LSVDPRWFESFFDTDEWLQLATTRDPAKTEEEVAFLLEHLPGSGHVLDLACGTGRISIPLAQRGYDVAGLDLSSRVLEVARVEAPELDFRQGDMRELPWADGAFDAVVNRWTAFGYFETQAEDERVLAEVVRVLRPGGILVLDTANQLALVRGFQHQSWHELPDGTLMLENRTYEIATGRSQAHWTFVKGDSRRELAFEHRLYTPGEYRELLQRAGFTDLRIFGNYGEPTLDTFRLQIVARKA
jgi:SAM-dependent methyltransferase